MRFPVTLRPPSTLERPVMASSTSLPGAQIGKYRILSHIATGGMGAVYKARDEQLGRVVALKVLAADLSSNPILVERFKREAMHSARLSHKNIVTIYDYNEFEGLHYLVMEYIEGIDLSEYIRRKTRIDPEEARLIIIQACKALEHAFSMGITHRDIKPSNFLLANDEGRTRVKLTDLGLSRMEKDEEFRVTRAGTTVGTVDYMSPEQARDSALADIRSDIYSLGCTLYHMLAGQPPFSEGGIGERVYKHLACDPPDVREFNDRVPASLWTVLRRMLAKHPDDRFQTPTEVIESLRSIADSGPVSGVLKKKSSGGGNAAGAEPSAARPAIPSMDQKKRSGPLPIQQTPIPDPPTGAKPPSGPLPTDSTGKKKKRQTTLSEINNSTLPDQPDLLGVTADQRQAATGQFSHAQEVLRQGGDATYAQQLLLSCCKLDPANVLYRKLLREVARDATGGKKSSWFGSLSTMPARSRLRNALKAGEHRKVLEDGEDLLIRVPGDVQIQLDMAEAANELRLDSLAVWLLEEARQSAPQNTTVLRALALRYEQQKRYKLAVAQWEKIREISPSDSEAPAKIKEISVNETLSRGNYRR
ncbi:MAG: protein kinase [Gemmataceae bacterium]